VFLIRAVPHRPWAAPPALIVSRAARAIGQDVRCDCKMFPFRAAPKAPSPPSFSAVSSGHQEGLAPLISFCLYSCPNIFLGRRGPVVIDPRSRFLRLRFTHPPPPVLLLRFLLLRNRPANPTEFLLLRVVVARRLSFPCGSGACLVSAVRGPRLATSPRLVLSRETETNQDPKSFAFDTPRDPLAAGLFNVRNPFALPGGLGRAADSQRTLWPGEFHAPLL